MIEPENGVLLEFDFQNAAYSGTAYLQPPVGS
jgi:hypothetical protein